MKYSRDFKGVWIPKDIWLDTGLSIIEKALLVEIDSLDAGEKGCFASNLYLSKFIQKSEGRTANIISDLRKRGYVKTLFFDGHNRSISLVKKPSRKRESNLHENVKEPSRKREHSNTESIYTSSIEKIEANVQLLELIAMRNKLKITTVKNKISEFVKFCEAMSKTHRNNTDLFSHFESWIMKQNLKDVDVDVELDWFMRVFNKYCKGDFVTTAAIRKLFVVQLSNGFTGVQMEIAIKNLFSSSDKNKFHKDTGFKFATPTYLLKEDNLNKYLNQRF